MTKRWNLIHNEGKMSAKNVLCLLSQHSDRVGMSLFQCHFNLIVPFSGIKFPKQRDASVKKANPILRCSRQSISKWSKEVLVPLYKVPLWTHLENCKVLVSRIREKITKMGRGTQKGNKEHQGNGEPVLGEVAGKRAELVCMSKIRVEKGYDYCLGTHHKGSS